MKKRKLEARKEMTNKECVKLLDEIWNMVQRRKRAYSRNLLREVARSSIDKRKGGERSQK
jgi:hypothetical protein